MSTSRRNFLTGVTAAAIGSTAHLRAGGHEMPPASTDKDYKVAEMFCAATAHDFLDVDMNRPHLGALLYGLVCLDSRGQELLLPNSAQAGLPMAHHPRIWNKVGTTLTTWDVPGYAVRCRALDAQGQELTLGESLKTRDHLKRRPWAGMRWVRHLKSHTGRSLLKVRDREDPLRVTTRVALPGGRVIAVPPHTPRGANTDWQVTTMSGTQVTQATTDAMLWTRQLPGGTAAIELVFRPLGGQTPAMPSVRLPLVNNRVTFAVTHAHAGPPNDLDRLEDTCAFALLLQGVTPTQYPIPEAVPGARQLPGSGISGDDGHCECTCA